MKKYISLIVLLLTGLVGYASGHNGGGEYIFLKTLFFFSVPLLVITYLSIRYNQKSSLPLFVTCLIILAAIAAWFLYEFNENKELVTYRRAGPVYISFFVLFCLMMIVNVILLTKGYKKRMKRDV